jgi:Kef-type K+ transport system membrane component KefB
MEQATSLILISAGAFLLPLIAGPLRLPAVVLEISFGVLAGPHVVGLIQRSAFLDLLAELGFFLLMFLSGFEIDLHAFERRGWGDFLTALVVFGLTLASSYVVAQILGHGLFMALVLTTTSVGVVVPTLRNTRRTSTPLGQAILLSAILADFLTLLGVTIFALIIQNGFGFELLNIPLFFSLIGLVLLALRRAAWWNPDRFQRLFSPDDPDELGIRASLALMLVFVGLSIGLGIEPILGAFLAGTVFALVFRYRGSLERQLSGFSYGFLIPVFFINVGVRFRVEALFEPGVLTAELALIVGAVAVKVLPSLVLFVRGLSAREVLAAGTLLAARLSFIIAVAELGVELRVIDPTEEAGVILLAALTTTVAPILFRLLIPPLPSPRPITESP